MALIPAVKRRFGRAATGAVLAAVLALAATGPAPAISERIAHDPWTGIAIGGYGVAGVARGVPQPSDPRLFAVWDGRLFLFFDADDLRAFREDPAPLAAAADARWPRVREELAD